MGTMTLKPAEGGRAWQMPLQHELRGERAVFRESIASALPGEVEFILSALEAARPLPRERRGTGEGRVVYRTLAELQLYADGAGGKPWTLYTRDVTNRGAGFVTRHRLPLGYGGVVHVRGPKGERLSIECTVQRCREAVHGWFEGALAFNREQWALSEDNFPEGQGAD